MVCPYPPGLGSGKGKTMTEHTPGPWAIWTDPDRYDPYATVWCPRDDTVTAKCAFGRVPVDVERANARLIAAAPDMLDELERLLDVLGDEDIEIVEQVIAKARGE